MEILYAIYACSGCHLHIYSCTLMHVHQEFQLSLVAVLIV